MAAPYQPVELTLDLRRPSEVNFGWWKGPPRVTIDGNFEPDIEWGRYTRWATPDVHEVVVYFGVLGSSGRSRQPVPPARISVDTRHGPQIVYYARSWSGWTTGNIGLSPVKSPGYGWLLLQVAVLVIILLFWMLVGWFLLTGQYSRLSR